MSTLETKPANARAAIATLTSVFLLLPSEANAATAQLTLDGTIAAECLLGMPAANYSLGDIAAGRTGTIGTVTVTCNLVGTGPTITITSSNNGLKRAGGSEVVDYTLQWPLAGTAAFSAFSASSGTVSAALSAATPGAARSAALSVSVAPSAVSGKPSGVYSDIITFSVTP